MSRIPIIAGNWKMHKTAGEAVAFVREVKGKAEIEGVESVICAPFTALPALAEAVKGTTLKLGAQNLHFADQGAYTGEISGAMLKEFGVTYVIVGHSERRQYFAETDETVNRKVHAAFRHGLVPIICVGELLEEREAGKTRDVVRRQTEAAFAGLTAEQAARAVVAYEPVWAIGTGRASTAEDANEVIGFIRSVIAERFGADAAARVRIQYGGSVKPETVPDFMRQPEIDGALVGGASLDPASYIRLVEGAKP
ncbi:MAG TPA: triose-phosphate isomerase [Paenibacillaceae bacterium]